MAMAKNLCRNMRKGGGIKPVILAEKIMKWKLRDADCVVEEQKENVKRFLFFLNSTGAGGVVFAVPNVRVDYIFSICLSY